MPEKKTMNGSWVVASTEATLCEGVFAVWRRGGMGREHVGQVLPGARGGAERSKGFSGVDSAKKELRECRRRGALKRLQRSENSANEICVTASASVADIAPPVTFRVITVHPEPEIHEHIYVTKKATEQCARLQAHSHLH